MSNHGSHTSLNRYSSSHTFAVCSSTMASQRSHTPESDPSTNSTSRQQLLLAGETIHMIEDPLRRRLMDHKERMEVMFWQESAHYRTTDYLALPDTLPGLSFGDDSDGVMSEQWRTRMCEWAYQCE